ncbi:MAG: hypothetical protein ISN29_01280 [Gammaproteobacteria bacterium AqS3]|nr:hypothetical protein [Gammaproteobacteria bacterium AqS3]
MNSPISSARYFLSFLGFAGVLAALIFAVLLPSPPVQAKRVQLDDGVWYEACYARKFKNYRGNKRRFLSGFRKSMKKGLEWHDNDTFARIREYRTDICTISGKGRKFFSRFGKVTTGVTGVSTKGQKAQAQKAWGEGFQLIALRHEGQADYKVVLRFNHVDLRGKPLQGSRVLLAAGDEIIEIEAIPAAPEIMRQATADSVSGGVSRAVRGTQVSYSRSRTTYDQTVWAIGGASFVLPAEALEALQSSGVRFRIYGAQVPKTAFYLPPGFLKAFLDAIAEYDAKHYG